MFSFRIRILLNVLAVFVIGPLCKVTIRKRLKRICVGSKTGRHAALGGNYRRNIATFNEELTIVLICSTLNILLVLVYVFDGFTTGDFCRVERDK